MHRRDARKLTGDRYCDRCGDGSDPPGFDAVALTTVLRAHENGDAIAVPAGVRSSERRSTTACFRLSKITAEARELRRENLWRVCHNVWPWREMIEFVEATCDEVCARITTASGLAATRRRDTRRDSPLGQPVDDRRVMHVGSAASSQADRP